MKYLTAKEKAKELVNKFYIILIKKNYPRVSQLSEAKQCALIAIDERIEEMKSLLPGIVANWEIEKEKFLNDVKKEIENF